MSFFGLTKNIHEYVYIYMHLEICIYVFWINKEYIRQIICMYVMQIYVSWKYILGFLERDVNKHLFI
jgi:hypothetical protein